jgi:hypothetical protein
MRPAVKAVEQLQKASARGLVVDTNHIVSERLSDGRVSLKLNPALAARLEAALAKLGV